MEDNTYYQIRIPVKKILSQFKSMNYTSTALEVFRTYSDSLEANWMRQIKFHLQRLQLFQIVLNRYYDLYIQDKQGHLGEESCEKYLC